MNTGDPLPFYRSRRWRQQTGSAGIAFGTATVLALCTSIVVARALGPANFGMIVLATTVVAGLTNFLDFSLEEAVVHHGARAIAEDDIPSLRGLLLVSLRLDVVVGIVVCAIAMLVAAPLASLVSHGDLPSVLIRIAALETLVITINGTTGATLMLADRPELRAWSTVVANGARLIAVIVAIRIFNGGAEGILWGYVAGSWLGAIVQGSLAASIARSQWSGVPTGAPPASTRELTVFGLHSSSATTVIAIRSGTVNALLGRTATSTALGLLSVAMFPVTLAAVVTAPMRLTAFAEQARLAAEDRAAELWRITKGYTLIASAVGTAAAAVGWLLLPVLIPALYSEGFEAAVWPARILLAAAIATLATAWAKALPAAVGRPALRTTMASIEAVVLIALMLAFGRRGAAAAATALSITIVTMGAAWIVVARRMLTGPRPDVARAAALADIN